MLYIMKICEKKEVLCVVTNLVEPGTCGFSFQSAMYQSSYPRFKGYQKAQLFILYGLRDRVHKLLNKLNNTCFIPD